MSKNITLQLPESEVTRFEALLDSLLTVLGRLEKEHPQREANIERMQTETRVMLRRIREELNVAAAII